MIDKPLQSIAALKTRIAALQKEIETWPDDHVTWCVWPDNTKCEEEYLNDYLTHKSDDFVRVVTKDEDGESVPDYDDIVAACQSNQKKVSALTPELYFCYDPEDGFGTFDTLKEALQSAAEGIEDKFHDGWTEDVRSIMVGQVTHQATPFNIEARPELDEGGLDAEGAFWPPEWDSKCEYRMEPLKKRTTTTECTKCGNKDLVRLGSLNLKVCTDCKTEMAWLVEDNEPALFGGTLPKERA